MFAYTLLYRASRRVLPGYLGTRLYSPAITSFDQAKHVLNTLKREPDNEVKLKIYALFKQATLGDCTDPKPSRLNFVASAKWQAWTSLNSMPMDEAKTRYIQLISDLSATEAEASINSMNSKHEIHDGLNCTLDHGIMKLCLNRPAKKNAITMEMYTIWTDKLIDASNNPEVKLVVITGTGDYFTSGNDLSTFVKPLQSGIPIAQVAQEGRSILERFVSAFIDCRKPLIAFINGPAVGIGVSTLGLCDLVVAVDHATFHTPFVKLGQTPEACSSYTFPRIMGPLRANGMLLFGTKLNAHDAYQCGLVNRIFPRDEFTVACNQLVNDHLAQLPPETLYYSKEILRARDRDVLHQVNKLECDRLAERWTSPECIRAVSQFFQRSSS